MSARDEDHVIVSDDSDDEEALKAELEELIREGKDEVPELNEEDFLEDEDIEIGGDMELEEDEDMVDGADDNMEEAEQAGEDTSALTLVGHEESVLSCRLARSAEGKLIAITGGQDDNVVFWNIDQNLRNAAAPASSSKAADSDEAGAEPQNTTTVIEMEESQKLADGHTDSVVALELSADNTLVASVGYDNEVHIREVANPANKVATLTGPGLEMEWGCWHPKGNVFLSGSADATVWMWHARKAQCMNVYAGHSERVTTGGFLCDGKYIATGSRDGNVIVWHPKTAQQLHNFHNLARVGTRQDMEVEDEEESPEVVCLSTIPVVPATDPTFPTHICNPAVNNGNQALSSGSLFAVGCSVGTVHICQFDSETGNGKLLRSLQSHQQSCEAVAWQTHVAPTWQMNIGSFLATASLDGLVRIYDTKSWTVRKEIKAHNEGITAMQWLPSVQFGYYFVTCSLDGTAKLWSAQSAQCVREFIGHDDFVLNFDMRVDGRELTLITCSDDGTAKVWKHTLSA